MVDQHTIQVIKREFFTLLQRDERLVELLLEEICRDDVRDVTRTLKGSELLGGLKQAIDVESIASCSLSILKRSNFTSIEQIHDIYWLKDSGKFTELLLAGWENKIY